jgi:hypothetical protein
LKTKTSASLATADLLQILFERDGITIGFFYTGKAGKDFQCWSETGKDGVRANDAFISQARHPFMNAAGQFL